MQRAVHSQGFHVEKKLSFTSTPFSLVFAIPLFIVFTLIFRNWLALVMQAAYIVILLLLCGFSIRGLRVLPLIPLLLFIVVVNSFRGGGEILYRAGPFIVMKQGVLRGLFYGVFVTELFVMSSMLTRSFAEEQLVSVFHTLGGPWSRKTVQRHSHQLSFTMMLFSILRAFHGAYANLHIFFKKNTLSFRQRTLLFVQTLFEQVMKDYETDGVFSPAVLRPSAGDMLLVFGQFLALITALLLGRFFGLLPWYTIPI
jgi:hypothetical protein